MADELVEAVGREVATIHVNPIVELIKALTILGLPLPDETLLEEHRG